jgi:hypothetical protein
MGVSVYSQFHQQAAAVKWHGNYVQVRRAVRIHAVGGPSDEVVRVHMGPGAGTKAAKTRGGRALSLSLCLLWSEAKGDLLRPVTWWGQ